MSRRVLQFVLYGLLVSARAQGMLTHSQLLVYNNNPQLVRSTTGSTLLQS